MSVAVSRPAKYVPWRAIAAGAAVLAAYHFSFLSLFYGLTLQTPLAYLALVPPMALILGVVRLRREPLQLPIHDRQVDYIIGLALLVVAASVALVIPLVYDTRFWLYRVDLLSLPFFVAGLVTLFYGTRHLWALRFPIAFLFLAWPAPYLPLAGDGMRASVDVTVAALTAISSFAPVAQPVSGGEGVFLVHHAGQSFILGVGSACSGVNSLVGFVLIGSALAYVVHGPFMRKVAWLVIGLVVIWLLNVVRIEAIFVTGALFGQRAALDVLHPIAGLIVFNLGVLLMLIAVRPFGLRFSSLVTPPLSRAQSPVRRARVALVLTGVLAVVLATANAGYVRYVPLLGQFGQPQIRSFSVEQVNLAGWKGRFLNEVPNARPYFGERSTWDRVLLTASADASLTTEMPVYVDLIETDSADALAAYGVEACYSFHGFDVSGRTDVALGPAITASVATYLSPKNQTDWTLLWWEWPVRDGSQTHFQRVVLLIPNPQEGTFAGMPEPPDPAVAGLTPAERFVVALARDLVDDRLQDEGRGRAT